MVDDLFTRSLFDGATTIAIAMLIFWMIATGRLVTRRENTATVADRDLWRETAQAQGEVIARVLQESETTNRLLRALPGIAEVER